MTGVLSLLVACGADGDHSRPVVCDVAFHSDVDVAALSSRLNNPASAAAASDEIAARWDRVADVAPNEIAAAVGRLREYAHILRDSGALTANGAESTMTDAQLQRYKELVATIVQDTRAYNDFVRRHCATTGSSGSSITRPTTRQVKSLPADAPENVAIKQTLTAAGLCGDGVVGIDRVMSSGPAGVLSSAVCGLSSQVIITSFSSAGDAHDVIAYQQSLCSSGLLRDRSYAVQGASMIDGESATLDAATRALGWNATRYCP